MAAMLTARRGGGNGANAESDFRQVAAPDRDAARMRCANRLRGVGAAVTGRHRGPRYVVRAAPMWRTAMRSSDVLFMLLGLGWGAYEALLSYRRRASDGGAQDQGTLKLLWRVLYAAVVVAVLLAFTGMWRFPPQWQEPLRWAGCALIAGGLALRLWAIRVLDRWFTVHVTIQADHRLIRRGPYRWLRHPSYTGALLAFYGLALGLGNGLSLLAIVPPVTWAFLRRIRVEEALLLRAFPIEYPHYAARSWRLLPFVW